MSEVPQATLGHLTLAVVELSAAVERLGAQTVAAIDELREAIAAGMSELDVSISILANAVS